MSSQDKYLMLQVFMVILLIAFLGLFVALSFPMQSDELQHKSHDKVKTHPQQPE